MGNKMKHRDVQQVWPKPGSYPKPALWKTPGSKLQSNTLILILKSHFVSRVP